MKRSIGTQRRLAALALAAWLMPGALLLAHTGNAQSDPASVSPDQQTWWRDKAAELRGRMVAAAANEQAATAAYSRMLTSRYPTGEAKRAILEERDAATKALADARVEIRDFKEQARVSSIPDRWIDPEGTPPPWWIDPDS
jgi:hypothetical protein